LVQSNKLP